MKIAISTRTDFLDQKNRVFINASYMDKVLAFSSIPVPVYGAGDEEAAAHICDALIIPGGYDIAPFYFQQYYEAGCTLYEDATQDIRDFQILRAFIKQGKPVLGICRGLQVINVFFKGTLHQNIDLRIHEPQKQHEHSLITMPETYLSECMPSNSNINSYHHQAIARVGEHLKVCGCSEDGCIEAIAHDKLPILGVQWHPELMKDDLIFPYFMQLIRNTLS